MLQYKIQDVPPKYKQAIVQLDDGRRFESFIMPIGYACEAQKELCDLFPLVAEEIKAAKQSAKWTTDILLKIYE